MSDTKTIRVAAVQFGAGNDVEANLQKCLEMIDAAAHHTPALIVLPEFVNHMSWYDDKEHCFRVSVPVDGPFMQAIAAKAQEHQCTIVVNATVQRADGTATGTSLMFGPDGTCLSESDKQVLMGHENDFLERAKTPAPIIGMPYGQVASYACMDGVINETPRALALRGAHILCNSLNSFALDEAALHVPVRAAENKVYVVAANKVDPLIPAFLLEPVSQATNIPVEFLSGAGESQVVAPDGTVLAKAPRMGDVVVVADIDVEQAMNKKRPDGTDIFANRRPELYCEIGEAAALPAFPVGAAELPVAVYQPETEGPGAIEEVAEVLTTAAHTQLFVLPELFCFEGGLITDPEQAVQRSQQAVALLAAALPTGVHVVTSLVAAAAEGYQHEAVLISNAGIVHRQAQLHRVERHGWVNKLGDGLKVVEMPWGRLALIVGDDSLYPETFRLAVFQGADVVALPFHVLEKWEVELGLLERSAENRVCIAAASRPTAAGQSLITTLHNDFTLMTPWQTRPFDGNISTPIVTRASDTAGLTTATIHPAHTQNKTVSHRTHLVDGRPWFLLDAITQA